MGISRSTLIVSLLLSIYVWETFGGSVPGIANQMQPMDVLFMIDGSGSVKPRNFNRLRALLKNLIDRMRVDYATNQGCHVALIQFSSRKLTKVEFNLDTYKNKKDMKRAIDKMIYQRKYTYTGYAMELANKEVFNGRGSDRPFAKNVLVLFTDGFSADPDAVQAATANMKSRGYHLMSVGFGPQRFVQRFRPELEAISTNMKKDVFLQGFDEEEEIANRILEASLPKEDCSINPCQNNGICQNSGDTFICQCPDEYEGVICEKKKGPCRKNPCQNNGICEENGKEFKCACVENFYGDNCEKERVVCTTRNTDILLIMDDSRSIKNAEFTQMKKFIIDLVYRFNISREQTRVALVQFSSKKFTRVEFYLNQYYDKESLMNRINSLTQRDGGSTYTDHALRMARDQIFNGKNGDRPNVRDVIVLLTDGQSHDNDAAIAEARLLRDDDVSIISIGVGQGEEKEKLIKFLTSLSFGSDYVFKVSFANLETIIDGVTTAACENLQEM